MEKLGGGVTCQMRYPDRKNCTVTEAKEKLGMRSSQTKEEEE